jgi:hypothetical protein
VAQQCGAGSFLQLGHPPLLQLLETDNHLAQVEMVKMRS